MATITITRDTYGRELNGGDTQLGDKVYISGTYGGTEITYSGTILLVDQCLTLPGFGTMARIGSRVGDCKLKKIERDDRPLFKMANIIWERASSGPAALNGNVFWEDAIELAKALVAAGYTAPEGGK